MFNVKLRRVPVDEKTLKVNMSSFKRAISKNTCLVGEIYHHHFAIVSDLISYLFIYRQLTNWFLVGGLMKSRVVRSSATNACCFALVILLLSINN